MNDLLEVLYALYVGVLGMYQGMVIGKMESKDISVRIVENPLLLTPIPLRQEHEKTLTFGKSMWNV